MGRVAGRDSNRIQFIGGIMVKKKAPTEKQTVDLLNKATEECVKAVAAVMEACATIHMTETHLSNCMAEFKKGKLATQKHLVIASIINTAITALIVLAVCYV